MDVCRRRSLLLILLFVSLLAFVGFNCSSLIVLFVHYRRESAFPAHSSDARKISVENVSSIASPNFHFSRYLETLGVDHRSSSDEALNLSVYSPLVYRSLKSIGVLWLDENGDSRWNEVAERQMFDYLEEKQRLPKSFSDDEKVNECRRRQFLVFDQHEAGFFSRHNCFLDQFGQSLYSPSMVILSYRRFHVSGADREDFRGEGVLRYFSPMSSCSSVDRHPRMSSILRHLKGENVSHRLTVTKIDDLLFENQRRMKANFLWYKDFWLFGYADAPHRRWLFDVHQPVSSSRNYSLSKEFLLDHRSEHLYHSPRLTEEHLDQWRSTNSPYGESSEFLSSSPAKITWKDRLFTSFLRYIFVLYFHHFPPRLFQMVDLLAEHWSTYLQEKNNVTLDDLAAIFVRRGDKMPEDSFWLKHHRWRNLSFYVKGLVDEEQRRHRRFSSIFVMTDDRSVMNSLRDYSDPSSKGTDESYAREHLKGREILFNVFAPQACFNPFLRIGFDQFLVSLHFLVQYSQFTVSHTDSNIGRYLTQIIYAKRQFNHSIPFQSLIVNAPDSL